MIYIVLMGLIIIGLRMFFNLKRYEYDIRQRKGRELLCMLYFGYLAWMFYKELQITELELISSMTIISLYIPMGTMMPLLFRKFRYLLMNFIAAAVCSGGCLLVQMLMGKHVQPLFILFAVFGVQIGFILCKILRLIIPAFKKGYFTEKKRTQSAALKLEAELMTITMLFGIVLISFGIQFVKSIQEPSEDAKDVILKEKTKFEQVAFANVRNFERYYYYEEKNPKLSPEEVVWHVEANLDREFYDEEYVTYVDKYAASSSNPLAPLLINKFNRVSDDFEPKELVKIEGDYVATPETVKAYQKMTADMEEEGMKIYVTSSYRTIDYQRNLYNNYLKQDSKKEVDTYSARPGFSEHHTGRALDVSQKYNDLGAFEGSDEAEWVYENAYKYGFIVRYGKDTTDITGYMFEPWHITYVGQEISQRMHDENIETLEEYVVKYGQ